MARYVEKEKERDVTVLGQKTRFNGTIRFTDELHIAGTFDGTIDAQGALVIKKTAVCKANYIKAASIIVEGTAEADMSAGDRIDIRSGSSVRGNLLTSRLRIADGVSFEGSVEMIRSDTEFNLFENNAETLKRQLAGDHHLPVES